MIQFVPDHTSGQLDSVLDTEHYFRIALLDCYGQFDVYPETPQVVRQPDMHPFGQKQARSKKALSFRNDISVPTSLIAWHL